MSDLFDALQNLNLYPVRIEVSRDFNRYIPNLEEPVEFNVLPLESKKTELEENSRLIEGLPSQEELDFVLENFNTIKPYDETQLPINLEPAIPNLPVHSRPFDIDEWLTHKIQLQNNPYKLFPQFNPEPLPNPPMSNENLVEFRHLNEELMDTGNRIQEIGQQISQNYDPRKSSY
ncbi:hypothetical protein Hdeb2414_s0002g00048701 [Helianthus debilis subsp. tardiflorus]